MFMCMCVHMCTYMHVHELKCIFKQICVVKESILPATEQMFYDYLTRAIFKQRRSIAMAFMTCSTK